MNTVPAEAAALAGDHDRRPAPQSEVPSPCGAARGQNVAPGDGGSPGRDSTPSPFGTSERKAIPTKDEPEKGVLAKGRTPSEEHLAGDALPQPAECLAGDASPQPAECLAGDAPFQSAERLTSNAPFQSSRHLGTGDASPQPAHPARTAERAANVSRETFAFEQVEQCSMPASRHRKTAQDHAAAPDRAAAHTTGAASAEQEADAPQAASSMPHARDADRSGDGARTQDTARKRPSKASAGVSRETPASYQEKRRILRRKRAVAIAGFAALCAGIVALWASYGPELLAFVADAPRFRAWVDEAGALSRIAFVMANMAQIAIAFLPGEPLELAAGYAFGALEGTLWCLVASALGTAAVMALVRTFGLRIVALFFPPEKIASMRWLRDARRFELLLFLCFLIPGTPKDLFTYVAGLGKSPVARIVALTTVGRIPSIVSSTLMAGAFGDGNYLGAAAVAALTVALAGIGVIAYRKLSSKHIFIENDYQ